NIGTEVALRAPPDGYTLLLVTTNAVNVTFYENLNFNFKSDIAPVAGIIRVPFVMEINPSIPAKTVPEFIAYAKANQGKINMASGGTGTHVGTGHESHLGDRIVRQIDRGMCLADGFLVRARHEAERLPFL